MGIRWRLFACLALLTGLTLLVLWLFQVRLLSTFYERERFSELKKNAVELETYFTKENGEELVRGFAREKGFCVRIFVIGEDGARMFADADINASCVIHHLSPDMIAIFIGVLELMKVNRIRMIEDEDDAPKTLHSAATRFEINYDYKEPSDEEEPAKTQETEE